MLQFERISNTTWKVTDNIVDFGNLNKYIFPIVEGHPWVFEPALTSLTWIELVSIAEKLEELNAAEEGNNDL